MGPLLHAFCDAIAALIDNELAIFHAEFAALPYRQKIKNHFRRPAQLCAEGRHHDRAIDKDGMREHGIEELVVGNVGVIKMEIMVGRALHADEIAYRNAHAQNQSFQHLAARRRFQIFDDVRLDAGIPDQAERVARCGAIGVVVNNHVDHWRSPVVVRLRIEALLCQRHGHCENAAGGKSAEPLQQISGHGVGIRVCGAGRVDHRRNEGLQKISADCAADCSDERLPIDPNEYSLSTPDNARPPATPPITRSQDWRRSSSSFRTYGSVFWRRLRACACAPALRAADNRMRRLIPPRGCTIPDGHCSNH